MRRGGGLDDLLISGHNVCELVDRKNNFHMHSNILTGHARSFVRLSEAA